MHKRTKPVAKKPSRSTVRQREPDAPEAVETPSTFLKPDEAHRIIGTNKISRRAFYNALNRGEIPNVRLGKRILIPKHAFNLFLEGKRPAA